MKPEAWSLFPPRGMLVLPVAASPAVLQHQPLNVEETPQSFTKGTTPQVLIHSERVEKFYHDVEFLAHL